MTPEEIERLRALCEAATPGPWMQPLKEEPRAITSAAEPTISLLALDRDRMAIFDSAYDATFVVAARSALPGLLDFIEHLQARVTVAETERRRAEEANDRAQATIDAIAMGTCPGCAASRKAGAS